MNIGIGDVIYLRKGCSEKYVIVGMKNYEDAGSCSYDRIYKVMKLKDLVDKTEIDINKCQDEAVTGTTIPFVLVENEAPFKISKITRYKVERKKAKTITIYE